VPLDSLYILLGLDPDIGEPIRQCRKPQTPIMLKPNCGVKPRPAHVSAREYALKKHKPREPPDELRVQGEAFSPTQSPLDRCKAFADPTVEATGL
jgi:hypothetical protein